MGWNSSYNYDCELTLQNVAKFSCHSIDDHHAASRNDNIRTYIIASVYKNRVISRMSVHNETHI